MSPGSFDYWKFSFTYFVYFATLGSWLPYWGLFLLQRGHSTKEIAAAIAVIVAMRIPGQMYFGWLGDRHNNSLRLVRLGSFLAAISFSALLLPFSSFGFVLLVTAAAGFFWAAVLPLLETITLAQLEPRPENYSWVRLWGSAGFAVAVAVVGWLLTRIDVAHLPTVVLLLLLTIWLTTMTLNDRRHRTLSPQEPLLPLLRSPPLWIFLCSCMFLHISHGPYYVFFTIHMRDVGLNNGVIGALWAVSAFAELLLLLAMPAFMRVTSLSKLLSISIILTVVRWLITAFAGDNLSLLIAAQCLHAASFGCFHVTGVEWIRRNTGKGYEGRSQSLYNIAGLGAGAIVGSWISGILWEFGATFSFVCASLAAVLALMLIWWAQRYNRSSEAVPIASGSSRS